MALNETQKNIIDGTIKYILDDLSELRPDDAIRVLTSIKSPNKYRDLVTNAGLLDSVQQLRTIFFAKYPQNRSTGDASATAYPERYPDGIINGIVHYWENGFGSKVLTEPEGILSLTSRNDHTSPPVTKEAVVVYITQLIDRFLEKITNVKNESALKSSKQNNKLDDENLSATRQLRFFSPPFYNDLKQLAYDSALNLSEVIILYHEDKRTYNRLKSLQIYLSNSTSGKSPGLTFGDVCCLTEIEVNFLAKNYHEIESGRLDF